MSTFEPDDFAKLDYLVRGPAAIHDQERRGQQALCVSCAFPKDCPRGALEAWGFVFGKEIDDLFLEATLPEGWTREATDHPMWTHVKDGAGRVRVAVFYKAFYDRDASAQIRGRYRVETDYYDGSSETVHVWAADGDVRLFETEFANAPGDDPESRRRLHLVEGQVAAWLDGHHPIWRDAVASWGGV